jgi:methylated-DNA-[protein]-cysteine S-methyltransferase
MSLPPPDLLGKRQQQPLPLLLHRLDTPLGIALLVSDENGVLRAFDFSDYEARMCKLLKIHYKHVALRSSTVPPHLEDAIARYFGGEVTALEEIVCETNGTVLQRRVWQALRSIPPGATRSYGDLARSFGMPNAARAVGLANGSNPIGVVVPCHRVIGANGALTGYAGGLHRKQWLLDHERKRIAPRQLDLMAAACTAG